MFCYFVLKIHQEIQPTFWTLHCVSLDSVNVHKLFLLHYNKDHTKVWRMQLDILIEQPPQGPLSPITQITLFRWLWSTTLEVTLEHHQLHKVPTLLLTYQWYCTRLTVISGNRYKMSLAEGPYMLFIYLKGSHHISKNFNLVIQRLMEITSGTFTNRRDGHGRWMHVTLWWMLAQFLTCHHNPESS